MTAAPPTTLDPVYGWVQAIPLPYLGWRACRCGSCGCKFRGAGGRARYEAHWLLSHGQLPKQVAMQWGATPADATMWPPVRLLHELARVCALARAAYG